MNKTYAAAWDEMADLAAEQDGRLVRDGHRFTYAWQSLSGTTVQVWAAENDPRFGVRVGEVSVRVWNPDAARQVIEALLAAGDASSRAEVAGQSR